MENFFKTSIFFRSNVLGIIESFTKTVVLRKFFQTNHSEDPELFQKNVLGIIESFTKAVVLRKSFQTNHSEVVAFSKKLSLVLCGQLFYRSSKNLATLTVMIYPLSRKATKIQ